LALYGKLRLQANGAALMKWMVALALMASPALADEVLNCKDPQDQNSMTQCAALDFEKADRLLNDLWPKLKSAAENDDKDTGLTETTDALLASQRAWLAFRDAECVWQGFEAHGGSLEPMIQYVCQARLTRERIQQLQNGASE
jgi:uncharacterized protein YecT (DUF1311 family)